MLSTRIADAVNMAIFIVNVMQQWRRSQQQEQQKKGKKVKREGLSFMS